MKFKPSRVCGGVTVELGPPDRRVPMPGVAEKWEPLSPIRLRRILVPVDFSECSRKALCYALPLAREFKAALVLVNVVQTPALLGEGEAAVLPTLESQMKAGAERELKAWVEREIPAGVKATALVRCGSPYREIVAAAQEVNADLIVISTHGHTGLKHVFLGSTAESVVRYATCPVFVVREKEHDFVPV